LTTERNLEVIDAEGIACISAKKRAKIIDTESIIMGEELTDLEINLAQQLLKKQNIDSSRPCCASKPQKSKKQIATSVLQRSKTLDGSNKNQLCRRLSQYI